MYRKIRLREPLLFAASIQAPRQRADQSSHPSRSHCHPAVRTRCSRHPRTHPQSRARRKSRHRLPHAAWHRSDQTAWNTPSATPRLLLPRNALRAFYASLPDPFPTLTGRSCFPDARSRPRLAVAEKFVAPTRLPAGTSERSRLPTRPGRLSSKAERCPWGMIATSPSGGVCALALCALERPRTRVSARYPPRPADVPPKTSSRMPLPGTRDSVQHTLPRGARRRLGAQSVAEPSPRVNPAPSACYGSLQVAPEHTPNAHGRCCSNYPPAPIPTILSRCRKPVQ